MSLCLCKDPLVPSKKDLLLKSVLNQWATGKWNHGIGNLNSNQPMNGCVRLGIVSFPVFRLRHSSLSHECIVRIFAGLDYTLIPFFSTIAFLNGLITRSFPSYWFFQNQSISLSLCLSLSLFYILSHCTSSDIEICLVVCCEYFCGLIPCSVKRWSFKSNKNHPNDTLHNPDTITTCSKCKYFLKYPYNMEVKCQKPQYSKNNWFYMIVNMMIIMIMINNRFTYYICLHIIK